MLSMDDADAVYDIYRHPEVMAYYLEGPHTSVNAAYALLHYFLNLYRTESLIWWGVTQHDDPRLIGMLGLYRLDLAAGTAETGFDLHPDFWGKGIMTEALRAVLGYGFRVLDLQLVAANTLPGNDPSQRLLRRCGFQHTGSLSPRTDGNFLSVDVHHFELKKGDFRDGQ